MDIPYCRDTYYNFSHILFKEKCRRYRTRERFVGQDTIWKEKKKINANCAIDGYKGDHLIFPSSKILHAFFGEHGVDDFNEGVFFIFISTARARLYRVQPSESSFPARARLQRVQ